MSLKVTRELQDTTAPLKMFLHLSTALHVPGQPKNPTALMRVHVGIRKCLF